MDSELAGALRGTDQCDLGRRIRNARLAAGLTQHQLASGRVTVSYVSRIEAGQRRPDLDLLQAFAGRLGQPLRQLVTGQASTSFDTEELTLRLIEIAIESGEVAQALQLTSGLVKHPPWPVTDPRHHHLQQLRARALEDLGLYLSAVAVLEPIVAAGPGRAWLTSQIALCRCHLAAGHYVRAIETGELAHAHLNELGLHHSDEAILLEVTLSHAHFASGDHATAIHRSRQTLANARTHQTPAQHSVNYRDASIQAATQLGAAAAMPLADHAITLIRQHHGNTAIDQLRAQLARMLSQTAGSFPVNL